MRIGGSRGAPVGESGRSGDVPRFLRMSTFASRRWTLPLAAVTFAAVCTLFPVGFLAIGGPLGPVVLSAVLGMSMLAVPFAWTGLGLQRVRWSAWAIFAPALVLACFSVLSGFYNGLTDEPFAMPAFLGPLLHGHDPYSTLVTVSYNQYGTAQSLQSAYVYLPALIFLQPFIISYKWFAVAAWCATVALFRSRPVAIVAFGQGYVGLLAASGFNDLPVLLLLTLGFVGVAGRRQRWAEWLALGCKQFANIFELVYYLVRREVRRALLVVAVSGAFAVPFLLWDPTAFVCGVGLVQLSYCGGPTAGTVFTHLNYWMWPAWAVGVYFEPLRSFLGRRLSGLARGRSASAPRIASAVSGTGAPPGRGGP